MFHLGQFQNSIVKYEGALFYARAQADHRRTSSFLRSIGLNYQYLGLYGLAIESYQEALHYLHLNEPTSSNEAALYNSMGNLYRKTHNESKSLELLHKALSLYVSLEDPNKVANVMNNLGANHQNFNNLDSSLYYFQGVLNLADLDIDSPMDLAKDRSATFNNIGVVLLQQEETEKAFPYIEKAYQIHKLSRDQQGLAISYNNLGDYWLKMGRLALASKYLDSAFIVLQETSDKELLVDNLELRFELLEGTDQHKEALFTYKSLDSLKDQLFQDEKLKVEEISNIYLLREKEFENQKISQEAALFALESGKFRQTSLFLSLLGIILSLFLLWVFRNLKRQRGLTQIISAKNKTISLQQTELRHRTANNIMRLQSIIKEIARRVPDNSAQQEMLRSTQLLYSAASLERYLFSIEDEKEVPLKEFLKGLMQQHREMLGKEKRSVEIVYEQSAKIVLPVASVIPISMILTEWIYNSLKYAFEGIDQPKITIAIHLNDQHIKIDYQDNGVGIKDQASKGTGTRLIEKFALDLNARIETLEHQGIRYQLVFNAIGKNLSLK
ncbi:DUF2225 domain-containing protein [Cyclobacterium qasimii]|uniref:Tetratricopeptide TPR_2 repeat protein n=1 Tax=Cyclobacterium qasimii M12-11B TaxID=641524 RepID=S7V592_9BACT|nr:DUF2225 domain-containing protein [Cyclobacterium qasimii]EPR65066.1 Tetratricopeptide TPR_2 repeat protein [Cyclobacterium qasimii M12-11B]